MWFLYLGPAGAAVVATSMLALTAPGFDGVAHDVATLRPARDAVVAASATRTCSEVVDDRRQLHVRMIPARGVETEALAVARAEVAAIWRRYEVDIIWEVPWKLEDDRAPPDLWVQFVDDGQDSAGHGVAAVAWIRFAAGAPLPFISVSRAAVTALLAPPSWLGGRPLSSWPEGLQHLARGRIIGRALAHEIGHYLLASSRHAARGLMQAMIRPAYLVKPGTNHLTLQDEDVRALRAARLVSCELSAAR